MERGGIMLMRTRFTVWAPLGRAVILCERYVNWLPCEAAINCRFSRTAGIL